MRSSLLLVSAAAVTAVALLHCGSSDVALGTVEDGGYDQDAPDVSAETSIDQDAGISDAATEDEYEIPDGAVVCDASPCVVALSGGYSTAAGGSFCALLADKTVSCWGSNLQNQLGLEPDPEGGEPPMWGAAPRRIGALSDVVSVSAGGENTCVRIADGGVVCWGAAALVNAGIDTSAPDAAPPSEAPAPPTRMSLVPPSSSVALAAGTACVTTPAGALWCWGNNASSQLGLPASDTPVPPSRVPLGGHVIASVHPGEGRVFAVTAGGALLSWGSASAECELTRTCGFLLGRDTSEDPDPIPSLVPGPSGVRGVATSLSHACAIAGAVVECWGGNGGGELGRGTASAESLLPAPTILRSVTDAVAADAGAIAPERDIPLQVVAGHGRSCAVMGSGRVYCWGAMGTKNEWGRPRMLASLSGPAVALALADGTGLSTACALLRSGVVECWGSNFLGALGRGNDEIFFEDPTPAPVHFAP